MIKINVKNNKACPAKLQRSRGFVILFAVMLSSIILAITLGVTNIAFREIKFSTSAKSANEAFFAADTGTECALLNDKSPSSFPLDGPATAITCALNPVTPTFSRTSTGFYDFIITGLGSTGTGCAKVSVTKDNTNPATIITTIISKGYNMGGDGSCNSTNPNLVERELKTTYGGSALPPPPPLSGFTYYRQISVNSGQVSGGGPLANFPVLVNFTDNTLKNGNGGNVQSSSGADIVFTSDSAGAIILPYEQESYDPATGKIVYWVNIPSLSNGTQFYMFYDKAGASDQSNKTAVWDTNFKGVWHMKESSSSITDSKGGSTMNAGGTPTYGATGKIDGAISLNSATPDYFESPAYVNMDSVTSVTVQFWLNATTYGDYWHPLIVHGRGQTNTFGVNKLQSGATGWANVISADFSDAFKVKGENSVYVAAPSENVWHSYSVTYDPSKGTGKVPTIYIDGVAQSSTVTSSADLSGEKFGNFNTYFNTTYWHEAGVNGTFDEVRISSSLRSPDWIKTEYNNQNSPSTFYTMGSQQTP